MIDTNPPTLTDCGCKATVYADGSGVDIEYCPVHRAAPALLRAAEMALKWGETSSLKWEGSAAYYDETIMPALTEAIETAKGSR